LRTDVAFAIQQFGMSERQACKLVSLDRSSYRYEPMPDHNAQLREELVNLARQKPRYGYRRLHALLVRRGQDSSPQRVYRVYKREGLAVRRLRRKRLSRPAALLPHLHRANQEWAFVGIHGLRWTREQAVAYFRAHAPDAPLSEIERCISDEVTV
jgi:hypothetical protein